MQTNQYLKITEVFFTGQYLLILYKQTIFSDVNIKSFIYLNNIGIHFRTIYIFYYFFTIFYPIRAKKTYISWEQDNEKIFQYAGFPFIKTI